MDKQKQIELLKATADVSTPEGLEAYRAFAASLTKPILQKVEESSYMRTLFMVERLGPNQRPVYPIATEHNSPVWIVPDLGYIAEDWIELSREEVEINTFKVQAAKSWSLHYAAEGRVDIIRRAQQSVAKALADFEEECGWKVVVPAATAAFDGAGQLPPRPAPIYEMPVGDAAAGYFSKELINSMIVGFQRQGRKLTELWISPEDAADIREYTDVDVDPVTRREIFQAAGLGSIWGVRLRVVEALGVKGLYNINDKTAEYGPFVGDSSNEFNDYQITNGNIVDVNGVLTTPGETQVYGFDTTDNALVMPIKKDYEAHDDSNLHRHMKQGFYGWEDIGMACLDTRFLGVGIIDRYTP